MRLVVSRETRACSSYYEISPSLKSISFESRNARKGKIKYRRATYEIRCRDDFCPTSRSSQESKGFIFRRATFKGTYKEAVEFRQGWSVAKNKGDVRTKRRRPRKVVCRHKKGT
jgi:hypothetical protein